MKKCNCINEVDDKLKEHNLRLTGYSLRVPDFTAVVSMRTEWIEKDKAPRGKRNSPPVMFASHCPFCGGQYAEPKTTRG